MAKGSSSAVVCSWLCVGLMGVCLSAPAVSSAHSCTEGSWYGMQWWTCDGDATYIVFGYIARPGGANDGYGICLYYVTFMPGGARLRGSYITCYKESSSGHSFYQVFAGAGNDLVRLATTTGETCGDNCTITGQVPDGSYFELHGEAGSDHLYLCDQANPAASDCVDESAAAYGGDGDQDKVYGTPWADYLSGGGGTSDEINGHGGADTIHDSGGNGILYGHDGCDALDADPNAGGDYCACGTNGGTASGCDSTDGRCGGCS